MALVFSHFEAEVSLVESSGNSVPRFYRADPDVITDYASVVTNVAASLPKINAVTDSEIGSYTLKAVWVEDALVLPTDAENNDQALLSAKIDGDPLDSATMSIPAATIDVFVSPTGGGRDVVDTEAGSIAYIYAQMFDATGPWIISDGERINIGTLKGKRRNTKSSNS